MEKQTSYLVKINFKNGTTEYISVSDFDINKISCNWTTDNKHEFWKNRYSNHRIIVNQKPLLIDVKNVSNCFQVDSKDFEVD